MNGELNASDCDDEETSEVLSLLNQKGREQKDTNTLVLMKDWNLVVK